MSQMNNLFMVFISGTGFVGRHLATFLINNQFCSKVRVVDKVPPATAWLNSEHQVP